MYCVGFRHFSREKVFLSADEVSFGEKIGKGTVMLRQRECVYTCSSEHTIERWVFFICRRCFFTYRRGPVICTPMLPRFVRKTVWVQCV